MSGEDGGDFGVSRLAMLLMLLATAGFGCQTTDDDSRPSASTIVQTEGSEMAIHYLEIVSNDVDALCAAYESVHGLSFGTADPDLGQARVAVRPNGNLIGIRQPLAEHEQPTMRTYIEVEDIKQAVAEAEKAGAIIAYPPTRQGKHGVFAIFIHGDVQHGLWQR